MTSTLTIPAAFSAMALRSGTALTTNPHVDEPLWDFDTPLTDASNLSSYSPAFRRLYGQFQHHAAASGDSPWSPNAAHHFMSRLLSLQDEWLPVMCYNFGRPGDAGLIALQLCWLCAAAAWHTLLYPNTRSYSLDSEVRVGQTVQLKAIVDMYQALHRACQGLGLA